jgi:hypothetical protein
MWRYRSQNVMACAGEWPLLRGGACRGLFDGRRLLGDCLMTLSTAKLPDGRSISCVNGHEVEFSRHETFSGDRADHGTAMPDDGLTVTP